MREKLKVLNRKNFLTQFVVVASRWSLGHHPSLIRFHEARVSPVHDILMIDDEIQFMNSDSVINSIISLCILYGVASMIDNSKGSLATFSIEHQHLFNLTTCRNRINIILATKSWKRSSMIWKLIILTGLIEITILIRASSL